MIENQRHLFDIPEDITYLNCAYLSPLLRKAAKAGKSGVDRKLRPWTIVRKDFFDELEEVRALFARLINASADDIAIVPASSYAAAIAGNNLPLREGQSVVVIGREHFSNVYQWKLRCREAGAAFLTVPAPLRGDWTQGVLDRIDGRTAIVAIPQCHWHDGLLVDIGAVSAAARSVGAALVVDGTQSVGAMPLDLQSIKPDFLFCSAYKWLLGPYGLGFLYVDPALQHGVPIEHHSYNRAGAAQVQSTSGYTGDFMPGARRYDFGERSNFITLPMMKVALEQLLDWGVDNIQRTLAPLVEMINQRANALGLRAPAPGSGASHFTGVRFPEGVPPALHDVMIATGVHVSLRGETLRISPHLYNSVVDIERFFEVLERKFPDRSAV
jgi:selenocysteine lyase/cysteine desulfurase